MRDHNDFYVVPAQYTMVDLHVSTSRLLECDKLQLTARNYYFNFQVVVTDDDNPSLGFDGHSLDGLRT